MSPRIILLRFSPRVLQLFGNKGSAADSHGPVLPLLTLDAVLLPGGGPEERGGDPGEAAGDHAPATSVLANSLAIVTDKTRTTEISLATNPQILITFTHTVLPLILYNIWVCHCP